MFYVMCHGWVQTIKALPGCYKDKKEAIVNHGKYTLFKTLNLLKLREDGYFNMSIYKKYRCVWKEVCDIPNIKLYMIASMPAFATRYVRKVLRYLNTLKKQNVFEKIFKEVSGNYHIWSR